MTIESTASNLRKTGISVIGDVPWGTHFCSFYEKKQDLLETLVLYFKAGLESKEFCVWVVAQALSVKEAKRALAKAVPDLERHLTEGDLEIHSNDEWYLRGGQWDSQRVLQSWREKLNQTSTNGHAGLRAAGDAGWIQNGDWMAFREYEEQVNALVAGERSIILCTYPLTTSPGDQVFDVAHIHHVAVARRNGSWETIEVPALKEAKAEIRRLNQELEQKVEERTRELATTIEALKRAEDRIRLVIDTIPTMAWSLRPDGVLDFLNQRWLDYTGLSLEEAIAEPTGTVHPEDLPRVMEKWLAVKDTSETYEDEMRLQRADGEYRWFLIRIAPLLDEQGNLLKRYGVSIDIEDRKRAEDALNAQALRYKTLLATSTDSIYVVDEKGDLQEANAAFLHRRGYTAAEVKGLNVADWDAQWSREQLQERMRKLVGGSAVFETRHRCKDGSIFDVEVCATSVRIGGEQLFFAVTRDITARKKAESALRQLAQLSAASSDYIALIGRDFRYQFVNDTYLKARGLHLGDIIGRHMKEIVGQERFEQLGRPQVEACLRGEEIESFEWTDFGSDLRCFLHVKVAPLREPDGTISGAVMSGRDITARHEAEQAQRESEERFRELAENVDDVFWLSDPQHKKILYINPAYERIWGRSLESIYASPRSWTDALHPDDRERTLALRADEHLQEMPDMTYRIVRPDGSIRWIHSREFPVKDAAGNIVRVAGIADDITERKRAEVALDERLRFETLLTELSAAFANLPATGVDQEIDRWLQNLVEFLDLDRAIFDKIGEDGTTLSRSHSHTARGIDTVPLDVANDQTPWITEQLLRGNTVKWPRIPDDVPEQALKEKEFACRIGVKSALSIPVCIGGSVICAISFTSMRIHRDWPDEMVARLQLVGEIFANAIARKRSAKDLEEANRQLRLLSRRLFEVQEEERRHLARELHDEIGQALTAAKINLQSVNGNGDGAIVTRLQETIAILDRLLGQVRQISLDLRPSTLDDLGLVPALRSLLDQQGRRASVAVRFSATNVPENINPEIQTTCFRIAQEAITNALRHAHATRVDVDLVGNDKKLRLVIRDNGKGFDVELAQTQTIGLGLIGIKERAALVSGQARITSSPNAGTTIEISLPLKFRPAAARTSP
jgi:PAS domain S-box-containing protein